MNRSLLLIAIMLLTACNTQKKEKNIVQNSCDCISNISIGNEDPELVNEVQKCVSKSYEVYSEFVDDLVNKYLEKNKNSNLTDAQNWVRIWLSGKLVEHCPRYSKIVSEVALQNRNSTDLIKEIANEVCEEIKELGEMELSWKVIDPIFVRKLNKNNQAIMAKYNLNDKNGMNKYSTDLVQELMVSCEKYKQFAVQQTK